jgi:hypothetical protein
MLRILSVILLFGCAAAYGQTVQCQSPSGAWGPCPFVTPVTIATISGTAQIANKVSAASGTTITQAFPGNTSAGDSILCVGFEAAAAIPVFTDAQSNSYIVAVSSGAAAPGYAVALANNIVGGTTDTMTLTTTSGSASFSCYELKGAVQVGQIWDFAQGMQATSATLNFSQTSATLVNEFAVVGVGMGAGTVNATPQLAGVPASLVTVEQSNTAPLSGGSTPALSVFYSAHTNISNSPTFTQNVSLSASETYSAILVSVKPASLSVIGNVPDPCQQGAGTPGNVSLTASGQIITGTAGKNVYVCSIDLITATAQNVALVEGTGTTCATNILGMAGGTTAATGWNLAANGGLVKGIGGYWVYKTAASGDNVCLLLSGSGQTSGGFRYIIE